MRARAIRRGAKPRSEAAAATASTDTTNTAAVRAAATATPAEAGAARPSVAALVFLRGRDADARLQQLVAERAQVRPVLGTLAAALLDGRSFEPLGFRCLGDWSRERLGVGARTVREWARVWRALSELPLLREAVLAGEISWTVARRILGIATPENQAACLETVRGRTVRAVKALLRAVTAEDVDEGPAERSESAEGRVPVRVACSPQGAIKWAAALELALGRHLKTGHTSTGQNRPTAVAPEAFSFSSRTSFLPSLLVFACASSGARTSGCGRGGAGGRAWR